MGMCGPDDPLFHASPVVRKGPISSKRVSSQDLLLIKFWNFSLYSLNFCPNFGSGPKIWKFSAHKPPNLEIFSSQAPKFGNFQFTSPSFRGKYQFTSPTLRKSGLHTSTEKKLSAPPPASMGDQRVFYTWWSHNEGTLHLQDGPWHVTL